MGLCADSSEPRAYLEFCVSHSLRLLCLCSLFLSKINKHYFFFLLNQPSWECLHHGNGQTLQIRALPSSESQIFNIYQHTVALTSFWTGCVDWVGWGAVKFAYPGEEQARLGFRESIAHEESLYPP